MRLSLASYLVKDKKANLHALEVSTHLWDKYPPGLGGFIDPCDYCTLYGCNVNLSSPNAMTDCKERLHDYFVKRHLLINI